jgi:hypothetical protein
MTPNALFGKAMLVFCGVAWYKSEIIDYKTSVAMVIILLLWAFHDDSVRKRRMPVHAIYGRTVFMMLIPSLIVFKWLGNAINKEVLPPVGVACMCYLGVWLFLFGRCLNVMALWQTEAHDPAYQAARATGWHPFWDELPTIMNPTAGPVWFDPPDEEPDTPEDEGDPPPNDGNYVPVTSRKRRNRGE